MSPRGNAGYSSIGNRSIYSEILINGGKIPGDRGWSRKDRKKIEGDKTGGVYDLTKTDGDMKEGQ